MSIFLLPGSLSIYARSERSLGVLQLTTSTIFGVKTDSRTRSSHGIDLHVCNGDLALSERHSELSASVEELSRA